MLTHISLTEQQWKLYIHFTKDLTLTAVYREAKEKGVFGWTVLFIEMFDADYIKQNATHTNKQQTTTKIREHRRVIYTDETWIKHT